MVHKVLKPFRMSDQHIPAWQRIKIKQTQKEDGNNDFAEEDPLNITTHLATGSLTKKEKQKLIRGDNNTNKIAKKKVKSNSRKKEKLAKDVREEIKRKTVLKDQLRYLIDFYLEKVSDKLPDDVQDLENVKINYPEEKLQKKSDEELGVVDVWKFSKQKQNWLIKHFFNVEELPLEYNELIMQYFKDLKGETLKQSISEKCQKKIEEWNSYVERELVKMKEIVEGNDQEENSEGNEDTEKQVDGDLKKNEEELEIPPNKDVASRCLKLITVWGSDNGQELKTF